MGRLLKLLIAVTGILSTSTVFSQIDTEFWFAATDQTMGNINAQRRDSTVYMVFSSLNSPATVTISQPANLSFTPITVSLDPSSTERVNLGEFLSLIETKPANQVVNTGLLIRSTAPITAYYEVAGSGVNSDLFALKGKNGLGTRFYTPFQTIYQNNQELNGNPYVPGPRSGFVVMATTDTTVVTITPSIDILGHPAGIPFEVELDRGQTYYCEAADWVAGSQPAGSLIESNKPITVTIKDDMIDLNPNNDSGADIAGDQLIAEEFLGVEHIIVKGGLSNNGDRVVVCAAENNVEITVDGIATGVTLNAGEQYLYAFTSDASYLETTGKVSVFHISGIGDQLSGAIIPPLGCTGSNQIGFVRGSTSPFFLTLTIRAGSEDNFELNGDPGLITAADFSPVPGSGGEYVFTRKSFSTAQVPANQGNIITNFSDELFHLGITNGTSSAGCNYGFFSAFSYLNLGAETSEVCLGDSLILDAGPAKTSYLWNTGEETQTITVDTAGVYWVEVFSGTDCSATDTINVVYYEPPIDLGPNDTICDGTSLELMVEGNYLFTWQDGSTGNSFTVTEPGIYYVDIEDFQQCVSRDSIIIATSPRPDPPTLSGEEVYCEGETLELAMNDLENASFRFILPDGTIATGQELLIENISTDESGLYQGFYIVEGCESFTDSLLIQVNPTPSFSVGEDISVCEGSEVTLTASNGDLTYEWNNGSESQSINVSETGEYSATGMNEFGCMETDTVNVEFRPLPQTPEITSPLEYCEGESATLNLTGTDDALYNWIFGDIPLTISESSLTFTEIDESDEGIYYVYAELENCISDSLIFNLVVNPIPLFSLISDTTICSGDSILLTGPEGLSTYNWSTGESSESIWADGGEYSLEVISEEGCAFDDEVLVITQAPTANFLVEPDSIVAPGTQLNFEDISQPDLFPLISWFWEFGDGNTSFDQNPIYLYETSGVFPVSLTVIDELGCTSTAVIHVISNYDFFIPDGFSPNGDGVQDVFEIRGLSDLPGTSIQIFNRWGNELFESNNYGPGNYWDGDDAPDGTYFYIVTLPNGESLSGSVVLAR